VIRLTRPDGKPIYIEQGMIAMVTPTLPGQSDPKAITTIWVAGTAIFVQETADDILEKWLTSC